MFHKSCLNLGEEVLCYPHKVLELLEIFDQEPWDYLQDNPCIPGIIRRVGREGGNPDKTRKHPLGGWTTKAEKGNPQRATPRKNEKMIPGRDASKSSSLTTSHWQAISSTDISPENKNVLPSVNIVCRKISLLDNLKMLFDTEGVYDMGTPIVLESEERSPIKALALIVSNHNTKVVERMTGVTEEAKELKIEKCQFNLSHRFKLYQAQLGSETYYYSSCSINTFSRMFSFTKDGAAVPLKAKSISTPFPAQLCSRNKEAVINSIFIHFKI